MNEHLSTLLRALTDGKTLQTASHNIAEDWIDVGPIAALRFLVEDLQDGLPLYDWWRVKPE